MDTISEVQVAVDFDSVSCTQSKGINGWDS